MLYGQTQKALSVELSVALLVSLCLRLKQFPQEISLFIIWGKTTFIQNDIMQ